MINDFASDYDKLEKLRNTHEEGVEDDYNEKSYESEQASENKRSRKETRWQKFLHILHTKD